MKRFDKRCIYTNLLSDLVRSALVLFLFFQNLIVDENTAGVNVFTFA